MGAQPAGLDVVQVPRLDRGNVDGFGEIAEQENQRIAPADDLKADLAIRRAAVSMANDVLAGLVDGDNDIAADVLVATAEPGRFGNRVADQLQPVGLRGNGQAEQEFLFLGRLDGVLWCLLHGDGFPRRAQV